MQADYIPLENKLLNSIGVQAPSFTGTSLTVSDTTSLVATLFFMLIGGAAFYRYAMAGIYRLEASENGVRKSNEAFRDATLGLLGVFLMFLIFFTFNRDLLSSDVGLSILKVPSAAGTVGGGAVTGGGTGGGGAPSGPLPTGACVRKTCTSADLPRVTGSADASVRSALSAGGINVNVGACSSVGQSSCTNVGGLPDDVVSMLKSLKAACSCNVTVSGGTEWWSHGTHGPGVPVVDLRIPVSGGGPNLSDPLYVFLASKTKIGGNSYCHATYAWNGWSFCDEKSGGTSLSTNRHWHVKRQ